MKRGVCANCDRRDAEAFYGDSIGAVYPNGPQPFGGLSVTFRPTERGLSPYRPTAIDATFRFRPVNAPFESTYPRGVQVPPLERRRFATFW